MTKSKTIKPYEKKKFAPIKRDGVNCQMCKRYPCFNGIEGMSSNLAETCHRYGV